MVKRYLISKLFFRKIIIRPSVEGKKLEERIIEAEKEALKYIASRVFIGMSKSKMEKHLVSGNCKSQILDVPQSVSRHLWKSLSESVPVTGV